MSRVIRQVRIDLPTRSSFAYFFVSPEDRQWDPWWGALYDYLLTLAQTGLDWAHEPIQNIYCARLALTDAQRGDLFRFLGTAPTEEIEQHRSLKRALALDPGQRMRVQLMYFSATE